MKYELIEVREKVEEKIKNNRSEDYIRSSIKENDDCWSYSMGYGF